ncbi:MAG: CvpA family protein [Alphaproteobacteria bacterium]|nr:CvpA family protein [Alphaproteobacteria bacterium]
MNLADWIILAVLLVSGLCALMRGIWREMAALFAWIGALVFTVLLVPRVAPTVAKVVPGFMGDIAVGVAIFVAGLLFFSYVAGRATSGWNIESPGPFGRTLGFTFGLGRGLAMLAILFWFYSWALQGETPRWAKGSKLMPLVTSLVPTIETLASHVGADKKEAKRSTKAKTAATPAKAKAAAPTPASATAAPSPQPNPQAADEDEAGYSRSDRRAIDQLLETTRDP